ncbi:MAG: GDSL-type esterase/lipase family protein [Planctomycetota bacterium]
MWPKRVAFFGSSSIYGAADSEFGGFVNRFRLWYESIDSQHRVYNLGIWGESTRELIDRIAPEASRRRPHLIMIYPGFNDCRRMGSPDAPRAVSVDEFCQTMRELICGAQAIADTVVMTGYPFDETRTSPYANTDCFYLRSDAEEYTHALVAAARKCDARVLDFFASYRNREMSPLLSDDGLHCNARGHESLFSIARDFFRDTFPRGT